MNLNDADRAEKELRDAKATGRPNTIARAILANVWPLYSAHFDLLTSTVEELPSSLLDLDPVLRILHPLTAVLARTTRPFKPLVYPDDARRMSPDQLDVLTLVQMIGFRFSGDVAAALIYGARLQDRISQVSSESRDRTDGPLWYYHHEIGSTLLAAGDSSRALSELATARQLAAFSLQPDAERLTMGRTALAQAVRGSVDDADRMLAEARQHPRFSGAHVASGVTTERAVAALIGVERMADDADDLLVRLEPADSIQLSWPFALLARTRSLLARQRPNEAYEAAQLADAAHPGLSGAFASDVIHAAYIESLWEIGDAAAARREAAQSARTGVLTMMATVRLALKQSHLKLAVDGLRRVTGVASLGPGERAEAVLLSAWLELSRRGQLTAGTAGHVARVATSPNTRRIVTTVPVRVLEAAAARLPEEQSAALQTSAANLLHAPHVEPLPHPALTAAELRVLGALSAHTTTAELAAEFHVSPNTIKSQLKSLYRKLDCSSREEAITTASHFHLISSGSK